ncbi:MAG TPA: VTT domain-containing protein [Stellaceae bacterium]|nr:VTT domain-containing protein [Stellaceae bacterium]
MSNEMTGTIFHRSRIAAGLRVVVLLLVLAGVVFAAKSGAMRWERVSAEAMAMRAHIADHPLAPLAFIALMTAGSLVFVPRTILVAAGGLVFQFWPGLAWGMVGSTLGALLGFLLARYVNAGLVDVDRLAPALRGADRSGWRAIALLRLLPLPHTPVNYALGLTRASLWNYLLGSFLGMLPSTLVFVQLGASGERMLSGGNWVMPMLAALALLAFSLVLPRFARRSLRPGGE